MDVDSDNNNGLGLPDRSPEEELVEDESGEPGKILFVNYDDTDDDGIPDYADFDAGAGFAPMVIQIPDDVDINIAKLKLTYEQSDPTVISIDSSVNPPKYEPGTGYLRIWTRNGTEVRNNNDLLSGGHFVRSDQVVSLSKFSIDQEKRIITLYAELVRKKGVWGGFNVRTEIIKE